jgi:hypothetical protein
VISLKKDGEIIEGDENLLNHAIEYYFELFGPGEDHNIHIDQNVWATLEVVSEKDNKIFASLSLNQRLRMHSFKWKGIKLPGHIKSL